MERPHNSFVIFQLGEGSTDSFILDLPSLLLHNTSIANALNSTQRGSPDASQVNIPTEGSQPDSSVSSSSLWSGQETAAAAASDDSLHRSMIVAVRYTYQGSQSGGTNTGEATGNGAPAEGEISLNVPNIPPNRTESQMNLLIELAASIALGAVAAFAQRRHVTISKEAFEGFPLVDRELFTETFCPICYDDYTILRATESTLKRSRSHCEDDEEEGPRAEHEDEGEEREDLQQHKKARTSKRVGLSEEPAVVEPSSSSLHDHQEPHQQSSTEAEPASTSPETPTPTSTYFHVPIKFPCGHIFGRTCAHEWLTKNNTCPLCRAVVHNDVVSQPPPRMINLPNIGSLLNPTNRDRPVVIFLDRNTNTLITRQTVAVPPTTDSILTSGSSARFRRVLNSGLDTPLPFIDPSGLPINATASAINGTGPRGADVLEPVGIPRRDPISQELLRELSIPHDDGIFPTGVASRRTRDGVETVNLEPGMGLSNTSRYLLGRRLALNQRRGETLLRFNQNGEIERVRRTSTNEPETTTESSSVRDISQDRDDIGEHSPGDQDNS